MDTAACTATGDAELLEASAERYGRLRLGHVADVMGGKLDPAEYLRRGRHAEWTEAMKGASLYPRPCVLDPVPVEANTCGVRHIPLHLTAFICFGDFLFLFFFRLFCEIAVAVLRRSEVWPAFA